MIWGWGAASPKNDLSASRRKHKKHGTGPNRHRKGPAPYLPSSIAPSLYNVQLPQNSAPITAFLFLSLHFISSPITGATRLHPSPKPCVHIRTQHSMAENSTAQQSHTTKHTTDETQRNKATHNQAQHNTTQSNTSQHNATSLDTTKHSATQHNKTQHKTNQHNTTQRTASQRTATPRHATQH